MALKVQRMKNNYDKKTFMKTNFKFVGIRWENYTVIWWTEKYSFSVSTNSI